jgi:hypothetical protein
LLEITEKQERPFKSAPAWREKRKTGAQALTEGGSIMMSIFLRDGVRLKDGAVRTASVGTYIIL